MRKLLKSKDIMLLTLAGLGDTFEEIRDPLHLMSSAYENMYGFTPARYKRRNFTQMVSRSLKTQDIEKIIKGDKVYLRITSGGIDRIKRDFPVLSLSKTWNKKWIIVIFDIEEKSRVLRNTFREKLKNLGFGMLQQSVWITPLPIGGEMMEFVETNNLSGVAFVLEVSHFLLGNPRELARKVWNLDKLGEEYKEILRELKELNSHDKNIDGRLDKSVHKVNRGKLDKRKKELKRKRAEVIVSLPFSSKDLLPEVFGELF